MSASELLSGFGGRRVYSVSEISARVRNLLEDSLGEVIVRGEITGYTRAASGHLYFSLKDEKSQIRCAMFSAVARLLRFEPENGMLVLAHGRISSYAPRSEYQLVARLLDPAGIGALQLAFEQLKKKLEEEGLFDPARKTKLPVLPRRLGIVTSPDGAAIRDILNVLGRRYPNIHVTIYPTLVQGDGAPPQIAAGVRALDEMGAFDVIIVTRGGGSLEDLWAFNDERVARAIAACRAPVISAVGHETDFTIADFAADLRAPTPSAAAEIVVGRKEDLRERIATLRLRMSNSVAARVRQMQTRLRASSPRRLLSALRAQARNANQRADELDRRLRRSPPALVQSKRALLGALAGKLEVLSPLRALGRGYAIAVRAGGREPLTSARGLAAGEKIGVRLSDGSLGCVVEEVDMDNKEVLGEQSI